MNKGGKEKLSLLDWLKMKELTFGENGLNLDGKQMEKIKERLYNQYTHLKVDRAMKSPLRKWALSLTGWKWWFYQIVVCGIIFLIMEWLLNQIGMTMLPWK